MAITKVQEVFSYTAGGGSATKNITISAPAAGNTLALFTHNIAGGTVSSVTGGGVTWALEATWTGPGGDVIELWLGPNSSGSGTTVAVTVSNTYIRFNCNVTEWGGMPTTTTADGGSDASTNNPNNVTPSVTPTSGAAVLLLAGDATYNRTVTAGPTGGFTALDQTGGNGYGAFAYQIVASASGSYQCGWTNSAGYSTSWAGLYAFQGSSGGGGTTPKNVFGKMLSGPFGGAI